MKVKTIDVTHLRDCEIVPYTIEELQEYFVFSGREPKWESKNIESIDLCSGVDGWLRINFMNGKSWFYNKVFGTYVPVY